MRFDPNPLYYEMARVYSQNKTPDNKIILGNEGGTRSSKTWDAYHLLYTFCNHNPDKGLDIYILRDTLTHCRDFTFKDFKKCMKLIGADVEYSSQGQKPNAYINGNNIYFRGLDSEENSEGYPSDIIFINEALETEKHKVNGLIMRCRMLVLMDWNPKFTDHWVFDMEKREDTYFTHTTYKNNKHLEQSIVNEILGYEPYLPNSYEIKDYELYYQGELITDKNQPPPHPTNVDNNTADAFRWKVYGLGLRGSMKGVIYEQLDWIEEFPKLDYIYANDFGFTNDPNALIRYTEDDKNIYFELLIYEPIDNPTDLALGFKAHNVESYKVITCDSSDKYSNAKGTVEMVSGLNDNGFPEASKVSKTQDIMFWIGKVKEKKLHCVKDDAGLWRKVKKERENYIFKEINGKSINKPIDGYDHALTAMRYGHMTWNKNNYEIIW